MQEMKRPGSGEKGLLHPEGEAAFLSPLPYVFDGPYTFPESLAARPGIYLIFSNSGDQLTLYEVGESDDVKSAVINSKRLHDWGRLPSRTVYYSATYTEESKIKRKVIEKQISALAGHFRSGDR